VGLTEKNAKFAVIMMRHRLQIVDLALAVGENVLIWDFQRGLNHDTTANFPSRSEARNPRGRITILGMVFSSVSSSLAQRSNFEGSRRFILHRGDGYPPKSSDSSSSQNQAPAEPGITKRPNNYQVRTLDYFRKTQRNFLSCSL